MTTERDTKHKPWTVVHASWETSLILDSHKSVVATCPIDADVTEETQTELEALKEERAHLIAAAPDLLIRLEWAIQQLDACGKQVDFTLGMVRSLNDCRAAISKATKGA